MKNKLVIVFIIIMISCTLQKNVDMYDGSLDFWTNDLTEIELVMSYVLEVSEYKELRKLNKKEKIFYLDKYWNRIDPDKSTIENELFNELKARVIECKNLFSGSDGGLMSDRAKIYIIYGPPYDEFKKVDYGSNVNVLVWKYKTGYEFNFTIDAFGRYKLKK